MFFPSEFYYAAISAIFGLLWQDSISMDKKGKPRFGGKRVGLIPGFIIWMAGFAITFFIVSTILGTVTNFFFSILGQFVRDITEEFLILLCFAVFYLVSRIKKF